MRYVIYSSLVLLFLSCKKKDDPVVVNEPSVFSFEGKINGANVNLYSGANDYYMYADHTVDANNVRVFMGTLGKHSGANVNALTVKIKDYRALNLAPTVIDSSLLSRYYNYCSPAGTPNSYSVTFIPQFIGGTPQNYSWTFHDGSSSASNPTKIYTTPGRFSVCLNITSATSCNSGICHNVNIGSLGNSVESGFAVSTPTGNALSFTAQPVQGTAPYTYLWSFGDSNTSTISNPTHTYATNGVYTVSLTVTDSKNTTSTYQNNVNTQSPGSCMAKFNYVKAAISNSNNLANVTIEWVDANGITYTSLDSSQPLSSGFNITSVEEYLVTEGGMRTKKIRAKFNCTLYNGSNSILLEEGLLVFAVGYP